MRVYLSIEYLRDSSESIHNLEQRQDMANAINLTMDRLYSDSD